MARSTKLAIGAVLATCSWSAMAKAQDGNRQEPTGVQNETAASPLAVGEIIVTAEKRATSLSRTPISVSAISGEGLREQQVNAIPDVTSMVPNLSMGQNGGYSQITIRGIGISNFVPSAESAVAVNVNEVYVSRPIAQIAGLYDVSALEVLRGPQGTLYGRNATAGSINITTTRPGNRISGYANLTLGSFNRVRAEAAFDLPIVDDTVLLRVAGFAETRDGYGKNLVTGNDIDDKKAQGIRATLELRPASNVTATLIGEYFSEDDAGGSLHYFGPAGLTGQPGALGIPPLFVLQGGYTAQNSYDIANGFDPVFRLEITALTGILEWDLGGVTVKSVTAYREQDARTESTFDGGSILNGFFIAGEPAEQFSQELQVQYDSGPLQLTAGAYLFNENDDYDPGIVGFSNESLNLGFPDLPQRPAGGLTYFGAIGGLTEVRARALFAQGAFHLTDALSVTAGIRYSHERKQLTQRYRIDPFLPYDDNAPPPPENVIPSKSFEATTPKFGVQYQISPATMVYAIYAKGFKSGGFDPGADPSVVGLGFEPEKLTDYEGGIKTRLFDGRVRASLSGFYYDYSNLQVLQVVDLSVVTSNAGRARLYGAELELNAALAEGFTLDANASWLKSKYIDYSGPDGAQPLLPSVDFSGNALNNAPEFTGHLGAAYRHTLASGSIKFRASGDYSSKFYFTPGNIALLGQKAFAKVNASVSYEADSGWHITGFVKNLTDRMTRSSGKVNTALVGNPAQGAFDPPREFGVELGFEF